MAAKKKKEVSKEIYSKAESSKEKILELAKKRFKKLQDEQSTYRTQSIESIKFTYNIDDAQWTEAEKTKRRLKKRPYPVHNKLRKFVAQVANRERDQRMAQKVKPVDDKADPVIADILTNYIHSIEYQSDAETIYSTAGEKALAGGFGYWRILTKFIDGSMEQELFIELIENQFSVYLHPKKQYGFIREAMPKTDFEAEYPHKDRSDFGWSGTGEENELWYEEDKLFVAEYFYKEKVKKTIAQVIFEGDIDGQPEIVELTEEKTPEFLTANGYKILKTRVEDSYVVKWCKITGNDIIEGFEDGKVRNWVGNEIPIIEVVGDKVNVAGKIYKRALTEDGKDPQRLYNFAIAAIEERASLAPKAPYIVTAEMIKGYESIWNNANEELFPYLTVNQTPVGMPKRQDPPLLDQGLMVMANFGDKDIQDTIGMYDSSLGERSNERTGKAIIARSSRSDMGTYHFPHNLFRAIQETTRQLIDIIPKVVDTQKMLRIRDYKGAETLIEVNKTVFDAVTGKSSIINDLSVGRYDVEASSKVWSTRREEAVQGYLEAMQYAPFIAPILAKYYFKNADFPDAGELAAEIDAFLKQAQNQKQAQIPEGGMQ